MKSLRYLFRLLLCLASNGWRKPPYPFVDDCRDKPLKLHIGPWGKACWINPADGDVYEVKRVETLAEIGESINDDIYWFEGGRPCPPDLFRENRRPKKAKEDRKSPKAIGFWKSYPASNDTYYEYRGLNHVSVARS